jgi:hypothetical protein
MRSRFFSLVALLALGSGARAATETVTARDAGAKPAAAKQETRPSEGFDAVPDSEKLEYSRKAVTRMKEVLSRVLKHLEEARDERDVVKLNCVNEKLTAVKGLLKISEQADVTMQEALARRDTEVSAHEFDKINIAQRKTEQLLAESEACVGELAVYAGDTQVEVVLEDVPTTDPTRNTGSGSTYTDVVRPPAASPYQ